MKDWYLMTSNTSPNVLGGYENDAFLEEKSDAFIESLNTAIGTTVMLYNSDLSEIGLVRLIIQDNFANTQLKSLERSALAPIGTLKAGMYIGYEDRYWLVSGYPGNNGICEKATLILCQQKIKWQDDTGRIIERWANFVSASKYDVGENGNYYITLTSNNFTVWIPEDDDGETLDGKRVFIDRSLTNPKKVFKITRSDDVLYLYGESHGGILSFIADKTELNEKTDRQDLGLCDYISIHETSDMNVKASITGSSSIRCGKERAWTITFKEPENIEESRISWNVLCEYDVEHIDNGRDITLKINDRNAIGATIKLQLLIDNDIISEKDISVIVGF